MKILWGSLAVNGRGKLGGHVYTKARSGATVRTRVTPANPQSQAQSQVRSDFSVVSRAWSGLTAAQRAGWNSAVDAYQRTNVFGDSYAPSGKNLFTQLNLNLLNVGANTITDVPSNRKSAGVIITDAAFNIVDEELDVSYDVTGKFIGSVFLVFEATPPMSQGVYNFSGKYRKFYQIALNDTIDVAAAYAAYVAKFGAPSLGLKVSIRVKAVTISSALASSPSSFDTIVSN